MVTDSGTTGLTLPGMMLLPGCSAGSAISAKPASGPLFIQRKSFAIFIRLTLKDLELPGQFHGRILTRQRREIIIAGPESNPGALRQMARKHRAEFAACALMPVPTAVPPCASA